MDQHRRVAAEGEGGQHEGLGHGDGLHDEQQLALVGAVGDQAGPRPDEQHGAELGGGEDAEGDAAVGELQDEQRLGDERQPVADLGDELAGEEEPEVAELQRPEGVAGGGAQQLHGCSVPR